MYKLFVWRVPIETRLLDIRGGTKVHEYHDTFPQARVMHYLVHAYRVELKKINTKYDTTEKKAKIYVLTHRGVVLLDAALVRYSNTLY